MEIQLIDNDENSLRDALTEAFATAERLRVAVAFARGSGLEALPVIERAVASGKELQLLAGIDFQQTDLAVLEQINRPPSEARVYLTLPSKKVVFHPKVYVAEGRDQTVAVVGSSNLTGGGLAGNVEANVLLRAAPEDATIRRIVHFHEKLWTSSSPLTPELGLAYRRLQDRTRSIEMKARGEADYEQVQREMRAAVAEAIGRFQSGRHASWLLVTSPENYIRCVDGAVWGDEDAGRISEVRHGDLVFFYVKSPARYLGAMGMVTRSPYRDDSVIWPDDDRLYAHRFDFELLLKPARPVPFRPLVPQLELFGRRDDPRWGVRLQASMRHLSQGDSEVLRSVLAMAQGAPQVA